MKLSRNFILLGLFLSLTVFQLVSSRPSDDDDEDDSFFSSEEEESEVDGNHGDHHDHHKHHQLAPPAPEPGKTRTIGAEPVGINTNANANVNSQKSEPQMAAPVNPLASGSNVAGFNESCGSRVCNAQKDLICLQLNNTCQCNEGFVYVPQTEGCLGIVGSKNARGILTAECTYDVQCHYGQWGTFSYCDQVSHKCQCTNEAVLYKNTCYYKKTVGDICHADEHCDAVIKGPAICRELEGSLGGTRFCNCSDNHVWDNLIGECLPLPVPDKALNSQCKSDLQCTRSSLGNSSKCDQATKKCMCYNYAKPGEENVVIYRNQCFPKKYINSTCISTLECEASLENAICEEHEAFRQEKVCKCPPGQTCNPRKNGAMGIFSSEMSRATVVCIAVSSVLLGRVSLGQTNVI